MPSIMLSVPIVVSLVLLLGLVIMAALWAFYFRQVAWFCDKGCSDPGRCVRARGNCPTTEAEPCSFPNASGTYLAGEYLRSPAPRRRGVVLFCHEYCGDRRSAYPYAEALLESGFDVFTFDFTGHGASEHQPRYSPRAWPTTHDSEDVRAAMRYLAGREDADPSGVAIVGTSRGASSALCAGAESAYVWGMVLDGLAVPDWVFAERLRAAVDGRSAIGPVLQRIPKFFYYAYAKFVCEWVARRLGHRLANVPQAARNLRHPVLLVHGECDRVIPVGLAYKIRNRMKQQAKLMVVRGARHNESLAVDREGYHERLTTFLLNCSPSDEGAAEPRRTVRATANSAA